MRIYYVEDEKDLSEIVRKILVKEGFDVTVFYDGESAWEKIGDKDVDLWILDVMLTGKIDGFNLIKEIKKQNPETPVIFTSARDHALDKIMGLELGSDDYLAKPFSNKELILRVKAILRRNQKYRDITQYDDYTILIDKREIKYLDDTITLTNKEFEMLLVFIQKRNEPISREELLEKIWGEVDFRNERVVDDLLRRLRYKLPLLKIETIYGYGYRLLWEGLDLVSKLI